MKKKSVLITALTVIHITLCVICSLIVLGIIAGVVYINLVGVGGYHYSFDLGVGTTSSYSFRVWVSTHRSYLGDYSSFFIRQDIETLADTLASRKDQHGKRLQTEIYQDKHILITQESAENGANYYLVTPNPDVPPSEAERITNGAYMYLLYIPWGRFCEANSNQCKLVFPYHLLDIPDFKSFVYGEAFSAADRVFDLLGDWDDVGAFYDGITSYEVTRPDAATLIVQDKEVRFGLKVILLTDGNKQRVSFVPEYPPGIT